jgi:hypothetical protein
MLRTARVASGGTVFHVPNRANPKARISAKDSDCAAFERVMLETSARRPMRLPRYSTMPSLWCLVLWPKKHDGDFGAFMQRLAATRVRRWHLHRNSLGCERLFREPS